MKFIVLQNFGLLRDGSPTAIYPGDFISVSDLDSADHMDRMMKMKVIAPWDETLKDDTDSVVGGIMAPEAFKEARPALAFKPVPIVPPTETPTETPAPKNGKPATPPAS